MVFALHSNLVSGIRIPTWPPRAWLGLNLGTSPYLMLNVNRVLNLSTRLVSPQYHCKHNAIFETVQCNKPNTLIPVNTWKSYLNLQDLMELQTLNFNIPRNSMGWKMSPQVKCLHLPCHLPQPKNIEFDTPAKESQYNIDSTIDSPNAQNEGVNTNTQDLSTPSTTAPTTAGTISRGRKRKL